MTTSQTQPADLRASLLALVAKWYEQASRSSIGGDHMDAVEGQTLQLCADELQAAIESLAAHRGEVEPVAWRFSRYLSGASYAWTSWLGMDELYHYGPNGDLVKGPAADWKVEYAYSHPPQEVLKDALLPQAQSSNWEWAAQCATTDGFVPGSSQWMQRIRELLPIVSEQVAGGQP